MAQSHVTRLFRAKVDETITNYARSLAEGAAKDYPAYMRSVGFVSGLMESMQILDEIEKETD